MNRYVYFAENPSSGYIKIGVSSNPAVRKWALGRGTMLLRTIRGTRRTEQRLHRKFRAYRVKGEWFRDCPEIRAYIREQLNIPPKLGPEAKKKVILYVKCRSEWAALKKLSRQTLIPMSALIRKAVSELLQREAKQK